MFFRIFFGISFFAFLGSKTPPGGDYLSLGGDFREFRTNLRKNMRKMENFRVDDEKNYVWCSKILCVHTFFCHVVHKFFIVHHVYAWWKHDKHDETWKKHEKTWKFVKNVKNAWSCEKCVNDVKNHDVHDFSFFHRSSNFTTFTKFCEKWVFWKFWVFAIFRVLEIFASVIIDIIDDDLESCELVKEQEQETAWVIKGVARVGQSPTLASHPPGNKIEPGSSEKVTLRSKIHLVPFARR